MNEFIFCGKIERYINKIVHISPAEWKRVPDSEYIAYKAHTSVTEMYFTHIDGAKFIFTVNRTDSEPSFVMIVEFDNEEGVLYKIALQNDYQKRLHIEYSDLLRKIHENQEKQFNERLNLILSR